MVRLTEPYPLWLVFVEPWYSYENVVYNWLIVLWMLSFVGIGIAAYSAYHKALGSTLTTFFQLDGYVDERDPAIAKREAEKAAKATAALNAEAVDALLTDKKRSGKGTNKPISTQSIDEKDLETLGMLLKKHGPNDVKAWTCLLWSTLYSVAGCYLIVKHPSIPSVAFLGLTLVRWFIVFHDACHNSFFSSAVWNKRLAWFSSTFVPMNASDWRASHNHHHRHLGKEGVPDLSLTVWFNKTEYEEMPSPLWLGVRIIRDPIVLPGLLSFWTFWGSLLIMNCKETVFNRACFYVPFYYCFGLQATLLHVAGAWVGGIIGIQLFHLQHQCNTPYRVNPLKHSKWDAGMFGSTHLVVWWPLSLFTLGIEFHHIHHASTQVPSYNLAACHDEGLSLIRNGDKGLWERAGVNKIGLWRGFLSCFHTMFESNKVEEIGKPAPRFTTFEPYLSLGLYDHYVYELPADLKTTPPASPKIGRVSSPSKSACKSKPRSQSKPRKKKVA
eukprot:Stramenopile-MAST_4_protein_3232